MKNKILLSINILLLPLLFLGHNYLSINVSEIASTYFALGGLVTMFVIFAISDSGKKQYLFFKSASFELKKITWAKKNETLEKMIKIMAIIVFSGVVIVFSDKLISLFINYFLFT